MRIRRICLTNLNSLRGVHELDLTREPLSGAGLFLISGATGAGKSTVLDALTLALYGRAARYGSEANPENMMSRHTTTCRAEVEFEVPSGCYRAEWELRRARNALEGKIQPPHRQLYDAQGTPLTRGTREAEQMVLDLIGLDYERFMRSALLAQGDFAAFLRSKATDRAELLERLTGAEIYSRLGVLAYRERTQREREAQEAQRVIAQFGVLEPEARAELEREIEGATRQLEALRAVHEARAQMIAEINRLEDALGREREAQRAVADAESERAAHAAEIEQLAAHRAAEPYAVILSTHDRAQQEATETTARLNVAVEEHQDAARGVAMAYRVLQRSSDAAVAAAEADVTAAREAQRVADKERAAGAELLEAHSADAELSARLSDVVALLGDLRHARETAEKRWAEWRTRYELETATATAVPDGPLVRARIAAVREAGAAAAVAAESWRVEAARRAELARDHLERARRLASFEEQRHLLQPGESCPLCGATEHPYAEGAAPSVALQELEAELTLARRRAQEAETAWREATGAVQRMDEFAPTLIAAVEDVTHKHAPATQAVAPFGVGLPLGGEADVRVELERRVAAYTGYRLRYDTACRAVLDAEQQVERATRTVAELRSRDFGAPPPDLSAPPDLPAQPELDEHAPLPTEDAPPSLSIAETAYRTARERATATAALLAERRSAADQAAERLNAAVEDCRAALSASPFASLSQLRAARLPAAEAQRIATTEQRLARLATEGSAQLRRAHQEIERLRAARVLEGAAAAQYRAEHAAAEQEREQLIERRTRLQEQRNQDDANHAQRQHLVQEYEVLQAELPVWKALDALIGSADGKRFRTIAQSVTLDVLVRLANRHLQQLSDRYRIGRQAGGELELEIEDLHQANTRRPMASLSGGESFLASLALALGLSDLAGRTVRIDSLFIDEGFGSLDHNTLDLAISALENLQQHRKTVGVISHVALMKERIGTQIVVEKGAGGVSSLRVIQN